MFAFLHILDFCFQANSLSCLTRSGTNRSKVALLKKLRFTMVPLRHHINKAVGGTWLFADTEHEFGNTDLDLP